MQVAAEGRAKDKSMRNDANTFRLALKEKHEIPRMCNNFLSRGISQHLIGKLLSVVAEKASFGHVC